MALEFQEALELKLKPIGKMSDILKRVKSANVHFQWNHCKYRPGFVYTVLVDDEIWLYYDYDGERDYDSRPHYPPGEGSGVNDRGGSGVQFWER